MFKKALFFSLLILLSTLVNAQTIYTLSGIKKAYLVVELSGNKVPKEFKKLIYDELKSTTDELNIDTNGYNQRSLAVIVSEEKVNNSTLIKINLLIGEEVKRLDSHEKTFALTYKITERILYEEDSDLEDQLEDSLLILLKKFSDQYKEENSELVKADINEANFASEMKYETNYKVAIKKAKKSKKNIMFVLVTNYCPWCRKFEKRVLLKKEVNKLVQKNYIPLILNKEKDNYPKELNNFFTPTINFISYKSLKSYNIIVGYNQKDEFLHFLHTDKQ